MGLKRSLYRWLETLATTRLDEVSSLQRIARDAYKYIEDDHEVIIQVEMQSGQPDVIIYSSTLGSWLPPNEHKVIGVEEKQQILNKLCVYLNRRKISYKIE